MIKHLLIAACALSVSLGASAQQAHQDGDSIVPPDAAKYGVYFRITSLLFTTVECSGFIDGMDHPDVVIPDKFIDSKTNTQYTVTSIAPYAFKDKAIVKSVVIPPTVTRIGHDSFTACSIDSLTIPGSVYHVDSAAFADNPLRVIVIEKPGENGAIDNDHSIELGDKAFGNEEDPTLTDVYIHYDNPPIVYEDRVPFPYVAKHNGAAKLHIPDTADSNAYHNDYCWADFFGQDTPSAVTDLVADDDTDAPAVYYTLTGLQVSPQNLTPGLYIVTRGDKVTKQLVR